MGVAALPLFVGGRSHLPLKVARDDAGRNPRHAEEAAGPADGQQVRELLAVEAQLNLPGAPTTWVGSAPRPCPPEPSPALLSSSRQAAARSPGKEPHLDALWRGEVAQQLAAQCVAPQHRQVQPHLRTTARRVSTAQPLACPGH